MRGLWNGLLGTLWRGLAPIHRPLVRRLDAHMNGLINDRLSAELEARLVPTLTAALETTAQTVNRLDSLIARTNHSTRETDQALNTLLGEVIRLREQIEILHQFIPRTDSEPDSSATLAIVDQDETCDPFESEAQSARVG